MAEKKKKRTFESALKKLEAIVAELEAGDLSLEDSIKKYEEGIEYSTYCAEFLDKMEGRVTKLVKTSNGKIEQEPFEDID